MTKRIFESGATRNNAENKLSYHGFNAPIVDWYYAQYMYSHRFLEDGTMRAPDNWRNGIPKEILLDSLVRHVMDVRLCGEYQTLENGKEIDVNDALCGIIFNAKAMLYDNLRGSEVVERNYNK